MSNKETNDKKHIKAINDYIKIIEKATPQDIAKELQPTKLDINKLSTYSKSYINDEKFSINHPELADTIKRGYEAVENVIIKRVVYSNSVGSMMYLKSAFGYRENAITSDNERITITIGDNKGKNKI